MPFIVLNYVIHIRLTRKSRNFASVKPKTFLLMNAYDIDLYVLLDYLFQKGEKEIRAYNYLHKNKHGFSYSLYDDRRKSLVSFGYLGHGVGVSDNGCTDHWYVTEDGKERIKECMENSSFHELRRLSQKYGVVRDQLHIMWESLPYAFIIYFSGLIIYTFIKTWLS